MFRSTLVFLVFISLNQSTFSQGIKCQTFKFEKTILLDTIPVEEASISLVTDLNFTFDRETNSIMFETTPKSDSISICFITVSPKVYEPFFNRDISTYSKGRVSQLASASTVPVLPKEEIFTFSNFDSYGSITRGVTIGNRQNLFVNSALNLQMEGQLSEDLFVSASITDQNIPYQPEGNTQQIRDFDNVYIKLYNDAFDLTAGDVVLTNSVKDSYFLKYYKNVQGLSLNYNYALNEKWKARSSISGSAAKGQFSSSQLTPIEGVQGPYRLVGPNGERFIIVLANSERVFIDGELLERGFDRDYVIDYNLGEVTFSNSVVITRFTRIRIDFEYAEQYYSRSNITATQEVWSNKTRFYFNYYQEKDNPGSTLGYSLDTNDLDALRALGDNNGVGLVNGADSVGYIDDAILYVKRDSVVSGLTYTIYEYNQDQDLADYRVSFTDVGIGNGDYQLKTSTANGRIYEWMAPVNGVQQGNYAPIRILPLPNRKQMVVVGNSTRLSSFETLRQELAISNQDKNLYSELNDSDNTGLAWRSSLESEGRRVQAYRFSGAVSFESVASEFQWIDRFRPIEYDRNWSYNIALDSVSRADRILKANASLVKNANNQLTYDYSYRNRESVINGHQNELKLAKEVGPILSQSYLYTMNNKPSTSSSEWVRFKQDVRLNTSILNPGYAYQLDRQKSYVDDSLASSLMHFHLHDFYLQSGDSLKTGFRADYIRRYDQLPINERMEAYTEADEFRFSVNGYFSEHHKVSLTANYRKVKDRQNGTTDENLLGKFDWQSHLFDDHVRKSLSFSTANTRELRREFVFILVPTGEGTHTWRDENADGVQDLNEFYEAINIDERNYAKIFTPTDEYINAFQSTFQQSIDVQLPRGWKSKGPVLNGFSKVSLNANVRINYKSTDNNLGNRLNPFQIGLKDTDVIAAQNQRRYSLFYNRNGSGMAFDVNHTNQESKSLLSNGFELRERNDWISNVRINVKGGFIVRLQAGVGESINQSDFLESRNFVLNKWNWSPELIWQPINTFRVSGKLERRIRDQQETENPAHSALTDFSLESTWIRSGKGNLNAQVQWISVNFEGEANTYLGYELLEGLQPGQNQKWNLNWQQSMGKGLQLTLQYNGRKSEGIRTIHTGTMQLTAFF